jgi:hypothetical protein
MVGRGQNSRAGYSGKLQEGAMMRTDCMAGMSADAMSHGSLAIALSCRGHKTARKIHAALSIWPNHTRPRQPDAAIRLSRRKERIVLFAVTSIAIRSGRLPMTVPLNICLRLRRNSEVRWWSRYMAIANPWWSAPVLPAGRQLLTANEQPIQNCSALTGNCANASHSGRGTSQSPPIRPALPRMPWLCRRAFLPFWPSQPETAATCAGRGQTRPAEFRQPPDRNLLIDANRVHGRYVGRCSV